MKNVVTMMVGGILSAITLMILMTIAGRSDRKMEICEALPSVVETTLVECNGALEDEGDGESMLTGKNRLLTTVAGNLAMLLDSESALRINIYGADEEKGLLSVGVTEEYKQPNGSDGAVESRRTAIIDRPEQSEDENVSCSVRFYVNSELYKACQIKEGDRISAPVQPQYYGSVFAGWEDDYGYLADFTQPVTQDRNYFAVFR